MFDAESIRNCEEYIISMQRRLDKAVADNDNKGIRETFDLITKRSQAVRIYATWKITSRNQGKYTAGIDGIALPRGESREVQNQFRYSIYNEIDILKRPDRIRRVFIPKSDGKQRPLGIPTIHDRIVQEIYRLALDPIVEYHFNDNSYGFRPKRSCHDAISHLFTKLSAKYSSRFIVEGDIKGCFDNINHNHITETLARWEVPNWTIDCIYKILKSKVFYNGEVYDSDTGTPQGGVISPLLANVALTTLDNYCSIFSKSSNPIVRYADDFVVVCKTATDAKIIKREVADYLSEKIGLELSVNKTHITHIRKGFNFLGFNLRKYKTPNKCDEVLLIKPEKERTIQALRDWKEVINLHKGSSSETLLRNLIPKLIGWGMYYRHVVSKETFGKIDYEMWYKLFKWAKRRHNTKSMKWIISKYFLKGKYNRLGTFRDLESGLVLTRLSEIPIRRFIKVNSNFRVYAGDSETTEYWEKREYTNAYNMIITVRNAKLFRKQNGRCYHCNKSINSDDIKTSKVHIHHIKPKSQGGKNNHSNLRLVHLECHQEIHGKSFIGLS